MTGTEQRAALQRKIWDIFNDVRGAVDDDMTALQVIEVPADRKIQDYRSTYNDIRDWLRQQRAGKEQEESTIDWNNVVFEVDLLKSQEINLDYILELIFEHNKKTKNKADLIDEIRSLIRSSLGVRGKESLVVDFINQADLDALPDKASENGTELNAILPKMSPLTPKHLTKKQHVLQKIAAFVEKFKMVGGEL